MSRTAFVDESEPDPRSGPAGVYLLVATLVDDDQAAEISSTVSALRLINLPKLHWQMESEKRRRMLIDRVAALPVHHMVVERIDRHATSERRRRLCLWRLLVELDAAGVESVCMESRQHKQNDRDLGLLGIMRTRHEVSATLRMHHQPGPANPLLWVPDVVAGAAGARHRGDTSFFDRLAAVTTYFDA